MEIEDLLNPDNVLAGFRASSKKQALQALSRHMAEQVGVDCRDAFDGLMERERLGSTGVGHGVAIPHARMKGLDRIVGLFAQLAEPIPFDSVDDQPVDLIFMLLVPEEAGADHLKALAKVSRLLRDDRMCEKLRATHKAPALFAMLSQPATNAA
ncbi:PTS IIA-like nitrogen regulatory protein PtsN [Gimibacter soli]|uniref:PTS IIA-like nitrogen regulatory protein PtsN n=1 Tax=Gimibacter soli TaxID=3024400 RepID=A0AAE9XNX6_9PROT|nr:PTS IIA-like nitrogen regulatory protein PtsN [Gimibacter soli]WCL54518.1 PTS IIA-like nitrogen regulatory protein PtsN [Gimibacter soli]